MKVHNERNAGRKPNRYESKKLTVPVELVPDFKAQIETYKQKVEQNAKHDTSKTD